MKKLFFILLLLTSCSKEEIFEEIINNDVTIENLITKPFVSEINKTTTHYSPFVSEINKTTGHYSPYFIPFFDYYNQISNFAKEASCKNLGGRTWLNINGNDTPDQVITLGNDCGDTHTKLYLLIDNVILDIFETPHFGGTSKVSSGDFNNDGVDDIVLFHAGKDNDNGLAEGTSLYVVFFDKEGNHEIKKLSDRKEYYHSGAIGDVDNDGDIDILPVGAQNNDGILFKNDGNGNFEEVKVLGGEDLVNAFASELYDVNGDGNLDFILGGHEWHEFDNWEWKNRIYLGNGNGTFQPEPIRLPTMENWQVVLDFDFYDLDNDGSDEIIITRTGGISNNYSFTDGFYQSFKIEILSKDGNSYRRVNSLNAPIGYENTWVEYIKWTGVYDVDGDGYLDIVPDDENLNDKSYQYLSEYRGLYYKGNGKLEFEEKYKK